MRAGWTGLCDWERGSAGLDSFGKGMRKDLCFWSELLLMDKRVFCF